MQLKEAERQLSVAIQQAITAPVSASLHQLLGKFDDLLLQVPQQFHLTVAGSILTQLTEVLVARSSQLLEEWEEKHNPVQEEPVLTAEMLQDVLRHTMSLHLEEVLEASPLKRQVTLPSDSVVGEIEKSDLLEFLDQVDQEQAKQDALTVAHDENITAWIEVISRWMQEHQTQEVSLLALQRSLQMPLIQLWLALLLGGFAMEQRGDFYQLDGIWIPDSPKVDKSPKV